MSLHERIATIAKHCQEILARFGVAGSLEWVCVFCQNAQQYTSYTQAAKGLGKTVEATKTGDIVRLAKPIVLPQGSVYFLKIRMPDPTRPELGDCDYAATDWQMILHTTQNKPGFTLIERPQFKMIELMASNIPSRVYFSNPTLGQSYGL